MTEPTATDVLRAWLDRYDANDKAAAHGRPFMWDDDGNITATSHNFDNVIPPMDLDEVEAVRTLLADHADDFVWEQWAVRLWLSGGVTAFDHDTEDEARSHHRQLLAEGRRADWIEVIRRVSIQGTWRVAPGEDEQEDGDDA